MCDAQEVLINLSLHLLVEADEIIACRYNSVFLIQPVSQRERERERERKREGEKEREEDR
jgi:hypothetical protein